MAIKGKISIKGTSNKASASVSAGPVKVGLQIDASNFFRGFSLSQRRLDELKLEIARMAIPFYQRLILRTPVWRGTARMNWYLNVDKVSNSSGTGASRRSGKTRKNIVDSALEKVANKTGDLKTAKKIAVGKNPKPSLAEGKEYNNLYSIKNGIKRQRIGTQSQYGVMTNAVTKMVASAKNNIEKNFKVTHGGPNSLFQKRSAEVSVITISNDLPYIKFLEGNGSPFGETYTSGSNIWSEKEGSGSFVNPGSKSSGAHKDSLSSYRKGFVQKTMAQMKGEFTRFIAGNKPRTYRIR